MLLNFVNPDAQSRPDEEALFLTCQQGEHSARMAAMKNGKWLWLCLSLTLCLWAWVLTWKRRCLGGV